MDQWILVVWWVGLLGALVPTLIILKEVALVVGVLGEIRRLAERTGAAADGIAAHLAPVPTLPVGTEPGEPLLAAAQRLKAASRALEEGMQARLGSSAVARLGQWIAGWVAARRER